MTIEMTTASMARLNVSGCTAPAARPAEAITKLNSPLWPTIAPARTAADGRCPSKRARIAIGIALPNVMISSRASTIAHVSRIDSGRRSTPIETKKNVLNSSRSGTISPSTLAVRSESASASPATKAPRATLTPRALAANAVPIEITATAITNSSRDRSAAMKPRIRGRTREPPIDHESHESQRDADLQRQVEERLLLAAAEGGQDDDERDRDEVLHDRDAEGGPPVGRGVEGPLTGDLDQDHGGADRCRAPDEERFDHRPAEGQPGRGADRHRDRHGHRGAEQDPGAHLAQLAEAELEAEAEHEQRDPDVGEPEHLLAVDDEARGGRADDQPGHDVTQHRRQPQPLGHGAEDQGRDQRGQQRQSEAGHRRRRGMGFGS